MHGGDRSKRAQQQREGPPRAAIVAGVVFSAACRHALCAVILIEVTGAHACIMGFAQFGRCGRQACKKQTSGTYTEERATSRLHSTPALIWSPDKSFCSKYV